MARPRCKLGLKARNGKCGIGPKGCTYKDPQPSSSHRTQSNGGATSSHRTQSNSGATSSHRSRSWGPITPGRSGSRGSGSVSTGGGGGGSSATSSRRTSSAGPTRSTDSGDSAPLARRFPGIVDVAARNAARKIGDEAQKRAREASAIRAQANTERLAAHREKMAARARDRAVAPTSQPAAVQSAGGDAAAAGPSKRKYQQDKLA